MLENESALDPVASSRTLFVNPEAERHLGECHLDRVSSLNTVLQMLTQTNR